MLHILLSWRTEIRGQIFQFTKQRLSDKSLQRYGANFNKWSKWVHCINTEYSESFSPWKPVPELLARYMLYLYQAKGNIATTVRTKIASINSQLCEDSIPLSHPLLAQVWRTLQKVAPSAIRTFLSLDDVDTLLHHIPVSLDNLSTVGQWLVSLLVILGFWFLLRPSEAAKIQPGDIANVKQTVVQKGRKVSLHCFTVAVKKHKTGNQLAPQFVTREEKSIPTDHVQFIEAFIKLPHACMKTLLTLSSISDINNYLCSIKVPKTIQVDEKWVKNMMAKNLPKEATIVSFIKNTIETTHDHVFVDRHSLRHGGAYHAFRVERLPKDEVKCLGRWLSDDMFKLYTHS